MPERYDVVVLGGGLAGLTFAIQLKQQRPQTSIAVLDRREGAAPEAAFKVGESTVPSGAHYFAEIVGAKDHLEQHHLRKMGLRFFLPEGDNSDITRRIEVGPFDYPPHDNYQVDRGRFENELARRSVELGVDRLEGTRVTGVELGDEVHTIRFDQKGEGRTIEGRWVVDAAGRAGIIKNVLGLAEEVPHHINASWFRLAGGLNLEDWGADDPEWLGRLRPVGPGHRQFSTNHLLDEGYWVWLIPLGSGPISIGIVADPRFHPYDEINTFDKALDWLRAHEPQLAASVEPRVHEVEDFLTLEDFAYGAKQVFSADRWCLVGEAGFFADPFYSPGSDFIGYSNLFTGDLAARDLDGEDIGERAEYWNAFYMRAYENALNRTRDLYPIFGNPAVMLPKLAWDGVLNHSGLVLLMLKNKITDLEFMKRVRNEIEALFSLNIRMQQLFRDWNQLEQRTWEGPPPAAGPFRPLLEGFQAIVQRYDDDEMHGRLRRQVQVAEAMAVALFWRAAQALPEPPDLDRPINPYAVSLDRDAWGALYDSPGLTLEQALEIAPGMQMIWLEPAAVS